ncbi:proton pump-interactor 1-like [Rhodamnia argentea]|uniref:Proton pump-interactor 1-like n=1 Tax=Rhodamnia argentea TaxID=178133 RepID=A0A8B8MM57_9MYRT|nr:proton pump-interactor 1-like [Rhodamnia argentea]
MGMEVNGFEMAPPPAEALAEADRSLLCKNENGELECGFIPNADIKFGSHGDGSTISKANKVSDANFPNAAADEWPAPNKIHSFYIAKCRSHDDPQIKVKIDLADREIQQMNQARFQITDKLRAKRSERADIITQLKALGDENKQFNMIAEEKRKEMEPLHDALGKLRNGNNAGRGSGICSSEEELNELIQSLNYRIQHESIPLAEEKQLLREIKQLEGTREKVIANAALRADVQGKYGQREEIQGQVKLMGVGLDGVRKDQQAVKGKIKNLREELEGIENDIRSLQDELSLTIQKRDKAYENMQELRKRRDEANAPFYQNRAILNVAKDLAAKKDICSLQELALNEVEKFFSLWNDNKSFRDDYLKRVLPSLDARQLSRDGRIKNPNEKPLAVAEELMTVSRKETMTKAEVKRPKEDSKPPPKNNVAVANNNQKEAVQNVSDFAATLELKDLKSKEDAEDFVVVKQEQEAPKVTEVDEEKLKEIKRQEQIERQKQALERKKKLAEKNAVKAAIKAQKEAEKKLKDREKKEKKKVMEWNPDAEELTEEATEAENVGKAPEAPAPAKEKVQKKSIYRVKTRTKGVESVPKAILRRRRSQAYWMWAVSAAVLGALVALAYAYYSLP